MSNISITAKLVALISGAVTSLIAGYVSLIGLHALFPSGGAVLLAMGAAMECGKVVAVACWRHAAGPLRIGLAALILLLCSINALGVWGSLSAWHLADTAPGVEAAVQADRLAAELGLSRAEQARAEDRLRRLDQEVDALPPEWVSRRQALRQAQAGERAEVQTALQASLREQRRIIEAEAVIRSGRAAVEAAPLVYAAQALGMDAERAVTLTILLLLLAFDPLGLTLVAVGSGRDTRQGQAVAPAVAPPAALAKAPRPRKAAFGLGRTLADLAAEREMAAQKPKPPLRVVR